MAPALTVLMFFVMPILEGNGVRAGKLPRRVHLHELTCWPLSCPESEGFHHRHAVDKLQSVVCVLDPLSTSLLCVSGALCWRLQALRAVREHAAGAPAFAAVIRQLWYSSTEAASHCH